MPRIARPPLAWSSVVMLFTTSPGFRNVFAPTIRPSFTRSVASAQAPSVDVALEDRLLRVADDRVEVVPRPERVVAELVDALRGGEERRPTSWPGSRG